MTSKRLTPIQSIKAYCRYDCCNNDLPAWKGCTRQNCTLYGYRMGKRPPKQPFSEYTKKKAEIPSNVAKSGPIEPTTGEESNGV